MDNYPDIVKENLSALIREMAASPELFVKNPGKDFTRNRKLSFETMAHILISMGGNSIFKELLENYGCDVNMATTSAFVQQRGKILPSAFEFLLQKFTQTATDIKTYKGYRLLGADGSTLHIATDPSDSETFFQTCPSAKGYNLLHLNAMYDLCNRLYVDAVIQPGKLPNERKALVDMVNRSCIKDHAIIIGDRYYESYNVFAHIEHRGFKYLIRVKDITSNGILSGLKLPSSDEFDVPVRLILTAKKTKQVKARPDLYRFIPYGSAIDFLEPYGFDFYTLSFRVVRVKINDHLYETLITNLEQSDFPPCELKSLYRMRWGIETSFRKLKYTIGLINFHSKKREFIAQEVFARFIMYNFTEMIASHMILSKPDRKLTYQVNFTVAVHVCRLFLRFKRFEPPPDVEAVICMNILPVRPDRSDERKICSKKYVSFLYRVA